jgi:hypothetical protein
MAAAAAIAGKFVDISKQVNQGAQA